MEVAMDERLEKALEFANYMKTLSNQRRGLQEQFKESLIYFYNGCQFTIDIELINYTNMLVNKNITTDVIFIDDNEVPISIENLLEFLDGIQDQYFQALNKYHAEYAKLKSSRTIGKLVNYE